MSMVNVDFRRDGAEATESAWIDVPRPWDTPQSTLNGMVKTQLGISEQVTVFRWRIPQANESAATA